VSHIQSPCILVCAIDVTTGYCFGCGRTREEIAGWMEYTSGERDEIMKILSGRLANIERKPRRETRRRKLARMNAAARTGDQTN
jgi:uncharacterized protein